MIRKKSALISTLAMILAIVAAKALCSPAALPKAYAIAEINVIGANSVRYPLLPNP